MVIEGADFFIRVVDLPPRVKGICSPNEDGTFNVYLNTKYGTGIEHLDTYFHEVSHIEDDDFYNGKDIREVEGL
jgi:hypothetical protein